MADETAAGYLDGRIDALREHFASLIAAAPDLPAAFGRVRAEIEQEWQSRPPGTVLGLILGFILLGFVVEAGYRYFIRKRTIAGRQRCRAPALDRLAPCPRPRRRSRLHARQRRRVPRVRLAAAHAPGGGRVPRGVHRRAAGRGARPRAALPARCQAAHPAGQRRRSRLLVSAHRPVRGLARARLGDDQLAARCSAWTWRRRTSSPMSSASGCWRSRSRRCGAARAWPRLYFVLVWVLWVSGA